MCYVSLNGFPASVEMIIDSVCLCLGLSLFGLLIEPCFEMLNQYDIPGNTFGLTFLICAESDFSWLKNPKLDRQDLSCLKAKCLAGLR